MLWNAYKTKYPDLAAKFVRFNNRLYVPDLDDLKLSVDLSKTMATRKTAGAIIQALAKKLPNLIGGSIDLVESNNTLIKHGGAVKRADYTGRNIYFGIREHAMGDVLNGIMLHGGWRVFGGTFLVFSDYCKPAVRPAALMHLPVIYVFTHDNVFLGEDGSTHQPVEHLTALRAIPHLIVIRPCGAAEAVEAWKAAIRNLHGPTALILTRQNVKPLDRSRVASAEGLSRGAYVLWENTEEDPDIILIASGSEVALLWEAGQELARERVKVRVVSRPSWELFERQSLEVRERILPKRGRRRVAVEAASPFGWERYVGTSGIILAVSGFGVSAPAKVIAEKLGFTAGNVLQVARQLLECKAL